MFVSRCPQSAFCSVTPVTSTFSGRLSTISFLRYQIRVRSRPKQARLRVFEVIGARTGWQLAKGRGLGRRVIDTSRSAVRSRSASPLARGAVISRRRLPVNSCKITNVMYLLIHLSDNCCFSMQYKPPYTPPPPTPLALPPQTRSSTLHSCVLAMPLTLWMLTVNKFAEM